MSEGTADSEPLIVLLHFQGSKRIPSPSVTIDPDDDYYPCIYCYRNDHPILKKYELKEEIQWVIYNRIPETKEEALESFEQYLNGVSGCLSWNL